MSLDYQNLLRIAYQKALESTNPSTQNGAILVDDGGHVLASAANTFPNGIKETPERFIKPLRYKFSVHAERNVLYEAARNGVKTDGLTMICCWATCSDCAQAIIQSGIKKLVTHKQALDRSNSWKDDIALAFEMLHEAGVELEIYDGQIGAEKILRSGAYWEP